MSVLKQFKKLSKIGSSNNSVIYNADGKEALKVLVHDSKHNHIQQCQHLQNEVKLLQKLNHENIIKPLRYHQNQKHDKQSFCCMSLELADMDLFSLIEQTFPKKVDVQIMRDLILQVCKGLQHLHNQGISHNDIKLENILLFLDEQQGGEVVAKAKIADFGFARNQREQLSAQQLNERWNNRSNCSLAPEILKFKENIKSNGSCPVFEEIQAEMFALGIMIFSAFFLRAPIKSEKASSDDSYYKYFVREEQQKFWVLKDFQYELKRIESEEGSDVESLKDLINGLLAAEPSKRLNIDQVVGHKWFQN